MDRSRLCYSNHCFTEHWLITDNTLRSIFVIAFVDERVPFLVRTILQVQICVTSRDCMIAWLLDRLEQGSKASVCFANSNLLTLLHRRKSASLIEDFIVLNDGIGVDLASRLLYGAPFPENLTGTDFTPALLVKAGSRAKVFLFGARPSIVAKAAHSFRDRLGVQIVGVQDGYGWSGAPDELIARINESGANIVLVALGNTAQEKWIRDYAPKMRACLFIGVGALFDFEANAVARAPLFVQKLRMEWLFRLSQEPYRLGRRYTLDLLVFAGAVIGQRLELDPR